MATTDTRTGFRLPWNTDQRSQNDENADGSATDEASSSAFADAATADAGLDPVTADTSTEGNTMPDTYAPEATTVAEPTSDRAAAQPIAAKRPNKFLADLSKAMQGAAESARDESLGRLQAEAKTHVEAIHERSATQAADLRRQADDDVAAIREWSKAEIARVREETDKKISSRKGGLEFEIEEHAARIERQIEHVQSRVTSFEAEMADFFQRILAEDDPTRFAALAENMPEPPPFDLDELAATAWLDSQPSIPPVATDVAENHDAAMTEASSEPVENPEQAMAAIQAAAEAVGWGDANEAEAAAVAEPVDDAPSIDADDPRLSALAMSADFAAAEAEALVAADSTNDSEDIPTIGDDALAARLAGLVPRTDDDAPAATDSPVTQVVVSGLVSVASIASFKRHLGRLAGVQSVGVSSGPDGEFLFAVTHGTDVVLRDTIPTLPGFQARVTGGTDTTIEVTARDPESEG